MKKTRFIALLAPVAAAALWLAPGASASQLQILFTGVDLCYDGETVRNVDEFSGYDLLDIAVFKEDGTTVGTSTPAYLQTGISGVENIPETGGSATSDPFAGVFNLFFGPLGADGAVLLSWDSPVQITFDGNDLTLLGSAVVNTIIDQNLPFGLQLYQPITVSFSTQVTDLSYDNGFLASLYSSGTGEIGGSPGPPPIPEPSTLLLLGAGLLGGRIAGRRRKNR